MNELSAVQRDLLYIISGREDSNGVGLKEDLDEYYGEDIYQAKLYTNLDALVNKGLVEKGPEDDGRSNSYRLTREGYRTIERREEWERRYLQESERSDSIV